MLAWLSSSMTAQIVSCFISVFIWTSTSEVRTSTSTSDIWPSEDSDQPAHSLGALRIANNAKFFHADNEDCAVRSLI